MRSMNKSRKKTLLREFIRAHLGSMMGLNRYVTMNALADMHSMPELSMPSGDGEAAGGDDDVSWSSPMNLQASVLDHLRGNMAPHDDGPDEPLGHVGTERLDATNDVSD